MLKRLRGKTALYAKYRPCYPKTCMDFLADSVGMRGCKVADMGSGTGIFSRLLCAFAERVYAVEPHDEMRRLCEIQSAPFENVHICATCAEASRLPENYVDFVSASQSFHWFDRPKFKRECRRILKPQGGVVLLWNHLERDDEVLLALRALCEKLGFSYTGIGTRDDRTLRSIKRFYDGGKYRYESFDNTILLTREQFVGRYLSSSFAPAQEDPGYDDYVQGLIDIFKKFHQEENIKLRYRSSVLVGKV